MTRPDDARPGGRGSATLEDEPESAPTSDNVTADTTAAVLSTQPDAPGTRPRSRRRLLGPALKAWRRLTSMRTALVLLFLLAVAAVPGSLLPQRPLNPTKVDLYLAAHPTLGPTLDRLYAFDVFASPWFAAIYLLLFISLVGCLVPRIRLHARALRTPPPAAPRHLSRLPQTSRFSSGVTSAQATSAEAAAVAARWLRGARWRVRVRDEGGGVVAVAAEKGYLRETGNLVFHVALTLILVAVAIGKLWGYSGTVLVEEGNGFCNTVQQFDSFRTGQMVDGASLAPLCANLTSFSASYDPDGTAKQFTAAITYTEGATGPHHADLLRVNHPLRLEGMRLYLLGHGFSPIFTVRDPSGQVFSRLSAPFLPQDANFTSQGALKLPDARPIQIGVDGVFAPTASVSGGILTSVWPGADSPAVAIFAYEGSLGLDSGRPQSVYSIDQAQLASGALKKVGAANLKVGQSLRLADGTSVRFDGVKQWASLQVSHDPSQSYLLPIAAFLVLGLLLSIRVRRRRVWVRFTPAADGGAGRRTVTDSREATSRHESNGPAATGPAHVAVEVGGLARTDAGVFGDEFARVVAGLRGQPAGGVPSGEGEAT